VANQWGRDSQGTTKPRQRSLLIPVLISMIFGAAISFGVLDYLQSSKVPLEQLLEAKNKISDLEQTVFSLRGALDNANTGVKTDPAKDSQISDLEQGNQALKDELDAVLSKVQGLTAENIKLKMDLQTLSDAANNGNDVVAQRVQQLEQANKQLADDFLSLQDSSSATIKALNERIKSLQSIDIAEATRAQKKLENELNQLQIAKTESERDLQGQITDLKRELAASQSTIAELNTKLNDQVNTATATSSKQIKELSDEIERLRTELAAANTNLADMKKQLADAKTQLADADAKLVEARKAPKVEVPPSSPPPSNTAKTSRDPNLMESIIGKATGSSSLTSAQKMKLEEQLIQGECVADSLKTALGRVPVLMLRDLIRDLNSDC
jgi:chromosome segregation ATPase